MLLSPALGALLPQQNQRKVYFQRFAKAEAVSLRLNHSIQPITLSHSAAKLRISIRRSTLTSVKANGWTGSHSSRSQLQNRQSKTAEWIFAKEDPYRCGTIIGTGIGGIKEIEEQHIRLLEKGPRKVSPFCVPKLMGNAASGNVAIMYGLRGPNICVVSACASASHAIGEAFCNIVSGRSDIIITGGSEAAVTPIGLASFCAARSLSLRNDNPTAASRPFDRDRDGFVLSEGAGILVLEEYEHAKKRGAKIYAELLGIRCN